VINDVQITSDKLILQARSIRDHNLVSLIRDNDTSTSESYTFAKPNITRDSQVIEFRDVGDGFESFLKVRDLLKVVSELDDGGTSEFSRFVHSQNTVLKVI